MAFCPERKLRMRPGWYPCNGQERRTSEQKVEFSIRSGLDADPGRGLNSEDDVQERSLRGKAEKIKALVEGWWCVTAAADPPFPRKRLSPDTDWLSCDGSPLLVP